MSAETLRKILTRDFILNFFAQFAFSSVSTILIPTIPIYLSRFEAKGGEIGLLIGILSVFSLLPRPFVGRALLRFPEKTFMIAGAILCTLSSIFYLFAPPFWPFFIVRILHGTGWAFFSTASFTSVVNNAREAHRGQLISYYYLSFNFAFALAPYCGMLLINRYGFEVLFWVCAGLSICALFATVKMKIKRGVQVLNQPIPHQPLLNRKAVPPAIIASILNLIWGAIGAFFPLYALINGISNPGIFFTVLGITLISGRLLGGRILDIYEKKKVIIPCFITSILSLFILSIASTLSMFIVVAILLGISWALLFPSLVIYAIEDSGFAPGPVMGTFTAIADLGLGMGPMIMGMILQWTGYRTMFVCLTLTAALNMSVYYYTIGRTKANSHQMAGEEIV
jgi:MFS family permease